MRRRSAPLTSAENSLSFQPGGTKAERGGEARLSPSQRRTVALSSLPAKETCSVGAPTQPDGSKITREFVLLHKGGTEVLKNSVVPPSMLHQARLINNTVV